MVLDDVGIASASAKSRSYNGVLPENVQDGGGPLLLHGDALLFTDQTEATHNEMVGAVVDRNNAHPNILGAVSRVKVVEASRPFPDQSGSNAYVDVFDCEPYRLP